MTKEVTKYIKVTDLREVLTLLQKEEISFSRAVEILNEKVENVIESRNKVFSELTSQAPLWKTDIIEKVNEESFYCKCDSGNTGFVALDESRLGCGICGKPL